jgi:lysophospholipase L1-like esterase
MAVTEMDPVEVAHAHDGLVKAGVNLLKAAPHLHLVLLPSLREPPLGSTTRVVEGTKPPMGLPSLRLGDPRWCLLKSQSSLHAKPDMLVCPRVDTIGAIVTVHLQRLAAFATVALGVLGLVAASTPAAAGPVAKTAVPRDLGPRSFESYVALGDSYTAGPLIPDLDVAAGCFRSTNNYPALLAARLQISNSVDVSCSGADTTDMTSPQTTPLGVVPAQFDPLSTDTELVTVSIGGNDFSVFGQLVTVCPSLRAEDPDGAPCRKYFHADSGDALRADLRQTRHRVDAVVTGIRERSPEAWITVIGYPRIVPPHGTCPDILPFADGDYRYVDGIERMLNGALSDAAQTHKVTYINVYRASLGHDACSNEPWVNGQFTGPNAALRYHPFEAEMVAVAGLVTDALSP